MLEEYMINMGYSTQEIELIKNSYPINSTSDSTLLYNMKNLVNYLHRNTINNDGIIRITTTIPGIITRSIEDIKASVDELTKLSFTKIQIFSMFKTYPYIIDVSIGKISNLMSLLIDYGFSYDNTINIIVNFPSLINIDVGNIKLKFKFFLDFGYDVEEFIKLCIKMPSLLSLNKTKFSKKYDELTSLGLSKNDFIHISSLFPEIFNISVDEINDRLSLFFNNGFSKTNTFNIIKKIPIVLDDNYIVRITNSFECLKRLDFTSDDIIKLCLINPYILLYDYHIIESNFKNFVKYNLYYKEVRDMILNTPLLLTYNSMEISRRLTFYQKNKLIDYVKNNSKFLLFNLDFIKNRLKYVNDSYGDLFISDISFFKKYHVTRNNIVEGE